MLAAAIWSGAYALELSSTELSLKLFFTGIEYIGIALLPLTWLALALQFSGYESWLSYKKFWPLAIIPFSTILLGVDQRLSSPDLQTNMDRVQQRLSGNRFRPGQLVLDQCGLFLHPYLHCYSIGDFGIHPIPSTL